MASDEENRPVGARETAGDAGASGLSLRQRLERLRDAARQEMAAAGQQVAKDGIRALSLLAGLDLVLTAAGVDAAGAMGMTAEQTALAGKLLSGLGLPFLRDKIKELSDGRKRSVEEYRAVFQEALADSGMGARLGELLTDEEFQLTMDWLEERLDGLLTAEAFEAGVNRLVAETQQVADRLESRMEGLLTAGEFRQTIGELRAELRPAAAAGPTLEEALALLEQMPTEEVPEVGNLPRGSRVTLRPNPVFVGRDAELKALAKALKEQRGAVVSTGVGGMGKSQLAVEFAHRYGRYFAGGVLWLSFENPEGIAAEVAGCGGWEGMNLDGFDDLEQGEQVKAVQRAWREPIPRLLIFDNCEAEGLVEAWRPNTGGCRLLVTSRVGRWSPEAGLRRIPLEKLPRPAAIELLRRLSGRPDEEEETLGQIAAELGDLPLALTLAGRYLAESGETAGQYLAGLRADDMGALEGHYELLAEVEQTETPTAHDLNVARTFRRSYERLGQRPVDAVARSLLAMAACFAPGEPIPWLLLSLGVEEKDAVAARNRLVRLGLADEEPEGAVRLHRLVAAFARALEDEPEAQNAVERAVISEAYRLNMAGYPAPLRAWQLHLRHVTEAALKREDERAAVLADALGYHLRAVGNYDGARPHYERALAIRERALGPEHPDTAASLNNLGGLLQEMGDYGGARPLYERALAIVAKQQGREHGTTATALNNLGVLLHKMDHLAEARPLFERALDIDEKELGPAHPDTATDLNNLGLLLQDIGDYAGARPMLESALAIREQELGAAHPHTAQVLNNLAMLLQAMGEQTAALSLVERALAIRVQELGLQHPDTAHSLNSLGYLLQGKDDLAAARPLYERALAIRELALGPEHPDTAQSLNNLGMLLKEMGDHAGARPLLERALAILEKRLGADHPNARRVRDNLAGPG